MDSGRSQCQSEFHQYRYLFFFPVLDKKLAALFKMEAACVYTLRCGASESSAPESVSVNVFFFLQHAVWSVLQGKVFSMNIQKVAAVSPPMTSCANLNIN